jgi:tetratricopeptide (TPR) repeat protein
MHVPLSPRISTFHFGFDYRNRAGIILARALWLLGYSEQAASVARQAAEEAWVLDHSLTLCIAHIYAVSVFLWIGDWMSAGEFMKKLVSHARRRSIVPYEVAGQGVTGFIMIKLGDADAGIPLVRDSLKALRAQRYELVTTLLNSALAEGLATTGQHDEALKTIDETIALIQSNGDFLSMAELLRIKAEILSLMPDARAGLAEDCFLSALELARKQSAFAWELRTASGLAQFRLKQGRRQEAWDLLKPVFDRVSEGFETADVTAARHLLDEIGP